VGWWTENGDWLSVLSKSKELKTPVIIKSYNLIGVCTAGLPYRVLLEFT
jgi:hypothetical protein